MSPFLSPWFLSLFLFHSLSLLFLVFFCLFLAFLLISPSLFFCCSFLPCFFAFVSRKILHLKGLFSSIIFVFWGFLFCFAFQIPFLNFVFVVLSVVCFGQHKCSHFSKKNISKTLGFVLRIVQSYRFVKGRFWGQIRLMFEKHCKNRHFNTRLRAWWSKQIRFQGWRVQGKVIMRARWKCEGAGPKAKHQKQTFQILGFSVVSSCFWSLVQDHWSD